VPSGAGESRGDRGGIVFIWISVGGAGERGQLRGGGTVFSRSLSIRACLVRSSPRGVVGFFDEVVRAGWHGPIDRGRGDPAELIRWCTRRIRGQFDEVSGTGPGPLAGSSERTVEAIMTPRTRGGSDGPDDQPRGYHQVHPLRARHSRSRCSRRALTGWWQFYIKEPMRLLAGRARGADGNPFRAQRASWRRRISCRNQDEVRGCWRVIAKKSRAMVAYEYGRDERL